MWIEAEVSFASVAVTNVKETEFPCKATTEEEVLEPVAAFVQLYRENSRYLHRIYKRVARVGLGWCQAQIADPAIQRALFDRFMLCQPVYQADP